MASRRTYCVNLKHRADKWARFCGDCPPEVMRGLERFEAVHGDAVGRPSWFRAGNGPWGCYRSHVMILERCLNDSVDEVLILEDDAIPDANYYNRVVWLEELPSDAEMVYLGGQLLHTSYFRPRKVNDHWYWPRNVNRTHAYMARGAGIRKLYEHATDTRNWYGNDHIDHHYGRLHDWVWDHPEALRLYAPEDWLWHQVAGRSDVNGRMQRQQYWRGCAAEAGMQVAVYEPRVAVKQERPCKRIEGLCSQWGRIGNEVLAARLNEFVREENLAGRTVIVPDHPATRFAFHLKNNLEKA